MKKKKDAVKEKKERQGGGVELGDHLRSGCQGRSALGSFTGAETLKDGLNRLGILRIRRPMGLEHIV